MNRESVADYGFGGGGGRRRAGGGQRRTGRLRAIARRIGGVLRGRR